MKSPEGTTGNPFIPAHTFWEGPDEIAWQSEGLLPRAALSIVAGPPKAGKTLLALNLALAVAQGRPFLGRRCEPARVGLIQLEDPEVLVRRRLKTMTENPPADLFLSVGKPWTQNMRGLLSAYIVEHGLTLAILDPLVLWAPGTRENSAEDMAGLLYELRCVVQETDCSVLIVHHSRKNPGEHGEAIRGSSAILGAVDVAIELQRGADNGQALLKVTSRFGVVEDEALELDVDTLTWRSFGSAREVERFRQRLEVIDLLEEEGRPLTAAETLDRVDIPKRTLYRLLAELKNEGMVDSAPGQSTRRGGKPALEYFLGLCHDPSEKGFVPGGLAQTKTPLEQQGCTPKRGLCHDSKPGVSGVGTNLDIAESNFLADILKPFEGTEFQQVRRQLIGRVDGRYHRVPWREREALVCALAKEQATWLEAEEGMAQLELMAKLRGAA